MSTPRARTPHRAPTVAARPAAITGLAASIRRRERAWVIGLLLLHAALIVWGAARNSVTFDENHHLPSGVLIVAKHDFSISAVNPPLVKALCAIPALALGARMPSDSSVATGICAALIEGP